MDYKKLSICIPTYNSSKSLTNCLQSIASCQMHNEIQICISDNASNDQTKEIVYKYKSKLNIKYHRFDANMGRVKNYLNVVDMADSTFTWLIGDDDLLAPNSIEKILQLIQINSEIDFFYIDDIKDWKQDKSAIKIVFSEIMKCFLYYIYDDFKEDVLD